jgi:hypothetical protein
VKIIPLHKRIIKDALKAEGLPNKYTFLGYALHLFEEDEFVASFNTDKEGDMSLMGFCWWPEEALLFKSPKKAREIAKYSRYEAVVVMLLDIGKRHLIIRIDKPPS